MRNVMAEISRRSTELREVYWDMKVLNSKLKENVTIIPEDEELFDAYTSHLDELLEEMFELIK